MWSPQSSRQECPSPRWTPITSAIRAEFPYTLGTFGPNLPILPERAGSEIPLMVVLFPMRRTETWQVYRGSGPGTTKRESIDAGSCDGGLHHGDSGAKVSYRLLAFNHLGSMPEDDHECFGACANRRRIWPCGLIHRVAVAGPTQLLDVAPDMESTPTDGW